MRPTASVREAVHLARERGIGFTSDLFVRRALMDLCFTPLHHAIQAFARHGIGKDERPPPTPAPAANMMFIGSMHSVPQTPSRYSAPLLLPSNPSHEAYLAGFVDGLSPDRIEGRDPSRWTGV